MRLVPEEAPLPTPGEPGVGVARGDLAFVLGRPLHVGLDQARIDQRTGLHEQALRFELTVHLGKQALGQVSSDQGQTKPAHRLAVGGLVIEGKPAKPSERQPVRQRLLQALSDKEYHRYKNSALSIASGGYDGRPHAPDRTGLTSAASGAQSIISSIRSKRRFAPTSGRKNASTKGRLTHLLVRHLPLCTTSRASHAHPPHNRKPFAPVS